MPSIFHAPSVDPSTVTPAELAEIHAEFNLSATQPGPVDFFQPDTTYTRPVPGGTDTFSCAQVACQPDGTPIALGYAPINLGGRRTWELVLMRTWEWTRGWNVTPSASPMIATEGA